MKKQQIYRGINSVCGLIKNRKFLLVRDVAYDYLDIKDIIEQYYHVEFSEFTPNPLYEQVCEGIKLFKRTGCEMIVAVGGGSAIDVAKCIKLFCNMDERSNYLDQEKFDTGVQLVAIPTTAGTGSESTRHAVIYYEGIKQSIFHESIVPDYVILESSVLKTLPLYQKKCTMLDALCQAIESYWSVNSTDESKGYSRKAICGIKEFWKAYLNDSSDIAAGQIMYAANFAGQAINITATTAAHAMSYKITSMYKFSHGHAVAMCMCEVWRYILEHTFDCSDQRGEKYLVSVLQEIDQFIDLEYFVEMYEMMDMANPVSNDREHDLDILTKSVNPIRLKNTPVHLSEAVLKKMYGRIVKE